MDQSKTLEVTTSLPNDHGNVKKVSIKPTSEEIQIKSYDEEMSASSSSWFTSQDFESERLKSESGEGFSKPITIGVCAMTKKASFDI